MACFICRLTSRLGRSRAVFFGALLGLLLGAITLPVVIWILVRVGSIGVSSIW
jgi:hypothetical protein